MPDICLALRNLVRMVREDIIHTAAVDVEPLAEIFDADAGALDVPARIAEPPRAFPFQLLIVEFRFGEPKHKIAFAALVRVL